MARIIKTPGTAPEADKPLEPVQAVESAAQEPSGLPKAEDIDPTKISRAVLTTSGWVCPG
jgi:hypothetical protein